MKLVIRPLRVLLPIMGSFLMTVAAWAADVTLTIEPQLISLLDTAVMKVEFSNLSGESVDLPNIDGLRIQYQGPQRSYNFVNGRSSSKVTHVYLIKPAKIGDFDIKPVIAKYKGGEKELAGKLRVIKKTDDKEAQELSELMYSRISSSRTGPYVHEPFDIELKVHVRDGIQQNGNFSIRGGIPEKGLDGELKWKIAARERKEIDGAIFNIYTLATTAKALTSGTFTFQPEVQLNVIIPRQRRRSYGFDDPFFGDPFGRQETRPYILECNALEVEVQPVPMAGRPDSFTGGVGILDFDVSVGPDKVKAGEPITVKMKISGRGNLSKITPPVITEDHNFKLYDARTVAADQPDEVRFEQVIIPKSDVVTNIPTIAFSYFNTKTSDFRTISHGPFPVEVEAVPQQTAQVVAPAPIIIQQETTVLGRDVVYLKSRPKTWITTDQVAWHRTNLFKMVVAAPALLLVIVGMGTARRNRLAGNVALARRQKAPRVARAHIQRAEQAMRKKDSHAFHEALWGALTEYFGHRLNLAPGEVSLQSVLDRVPREQDSLETLFNTIEQRRYAYGTDGEEKDEMKALLKQLTATLKKCERMKI